MLHRYRPRGRRLAAAGFVLCAAALAVPAALAGIGVSAGPVSPVAVTLDGTDQSPTYTLPVNVIGAGDKGWNLTITSTTFATAGGAQLLDPGASQVTGVAFSCTAGCTPRPSVTNGVSYPLAVPAGYPAAPAPVKLVSASNPDSKGSWSVNATVQVAVPATAYAGTYTSAITIAVANGP